MCSWGGGVDGKVACRWKPDSCLTFAMAGRHCTEHQEAPSSGPSSSNQHRTESGRVLSPQTLQDSVLSPLKFRSILIAMQLPFVLSSSDAVK